jgi:hypothetical protein
MFTENIDGLEASRKPKLLGAITLRKDHSMIVIALWDCHRRVRKMKS